MDKMDVELQNVKSNKKDDVKAILQILPENEKLKDNAPRKDFYKITGDVVQDVSKVLDMKENLIWKGFPLLERFWYMIFCKTKCITNLTSNQFPIDEFLNKPSVIDSKINFLNKIVNLKILRTGHLSIESNIIHPFVKVSIIDLNTLRYIQKQNFKEQVFSRKEKNLKVMHNSTTKDYQFIESELDYIHPFTTCPYDLRDKGEPFANWLEEFVINEDASNIFKSNTVIFFEVLDYDFTSLTGNQKIYNSNNKYSHNNNSEDDFMVPIAWGYLKPVGYSQTHLGRMKIQLYKYKYQRPVDFINDRSRGKAFQRTPDVLFEFNYFKREMYQTYLEIELYLENKPSKEDLTFNKKYQNLWKYKLSVFYKEDNDDVILDQIKEDILDKKDDDKIDDTDIKKNNHLIKIIRRKDDPCEIPNKIYGKLITSKLGCMSIKFSPNGKYIAVACTNLDSNTTIKIFNVYDLLLRYHFIGHSEIIHSLEWTKNSKILISCSADFKVKLWGIPTKENSNPENLEYLDNERSFLITTINHPSYVYNTKIISLVNEKSHDLITYKFILGTVSADSFVRFYEIILNIDEINKNQYRIFKQTLIYSVDISIDYHEDDYRKFKNDYLKNKVKKGVEKKKKFIQSDKKINKKLDKVSFVMQKDKQINEEDDDTNDKLFDIEFNENELLLQPTIIDKRFPNSITSDDMGRIFVGDSMGTLHIWEMVYDNEYKFKKVVSVTHKKIEGDIINCMSVDPLKKSKLLVHSRDNSIRLLDPFGNQGKLSIETEYKGLKCSSTNLKSVISPDGQFILSGCEEGSPKLWHLLTSFSIDKLICHETKFNDFVSDVDWNNNLNMIAVAGFSQEYPVMLYVYEKSANEINLDLLKLNMIKNYDNDDDNLNFEELDNRMKTGS